MRLKKCYIQNFGRLHEFTFDFKDGLNVIKQENGWGKTTLATFIKVMLYGMDKGGTKATKSLKERNRYFPWQGGVYGGYLIFEWKNKEYRVERTFGEKEKEDTCVLYSNETMLSLPLPKEALGEWIFKLDRESFERSIFISLKTDSEGGFLTDNVNARLNNLIENADDIGNYEAALKRLNDAKKEFGKKIKELRERALNKKEELTISNRKADALRQRQDYITILMNDKKALEDQRNCVSEEISSAGNYEKKKSYLHFVQKSAEADRSYQELIREFPGEQPGYGELNQEQIHMSLIDQKKRQINELALSEEEQQQISHLSVKFADSVPTEEDFVQLQEVIIRYEEKKTQSKTKEDGTENRELQELETLFGGKIPTEELLMEKNQLNSELMMLMNEKRDVQSRLTLLLQQKTDLQRERENARKETAKKKSKSIICLLGGGIAVILAMVIVLCLPTYYIGAIILLLLGVAALLGGILFARKAGVKAELHADGAEEEELNRKLAVLSGREDAIRVDLNGFLSAFTVLEKDADLSRELTLIESKNSNFKRLKKEEEQAVEKRQKTLEEADDFRKKIEEAFRKFGMNCEEGSYRIALKQLKSETELYRKGMLQKEKQAATMEELEQLLKKANMFKDKYHISDEDYNQGYLEKIGTVVHDMDAAKKLSEEAKKELEAFVRENDVAKLNDIQAPSRSPEELQIMFQQITGQVDEKAKSIVSYERESDGYRAIVDKKPELESEIEAVTEELKVHEKKLTCIENTILYLSQAKERISLRYMAGMRNAFSSYVRMMNGESMLDIKLNIDLDASVEAYGQTWKSEYLSAGFRDLIVVCTKLSLVEAMFEEENPFIILDDPFINLDESKVIHATELLEKIAEKHQLLYFICHESRNVPSR